MKLLGLTLAAFLLAAMPVAQASTVSTITLPEGTWNVTATVGGHDANNGLAFGMTSPENFQVCTDCVVGDSHTFTGLSGELVFYMTDLQCNEMFSSTDPNSAQIDQTSSTTWNIGWDDGGDCESRDGDFNDLVTTITAWQPGSNPDFAATDYTGNATTISTVFGSTDNMKTTVNAPDSTGGYQNGSVIDQELNTTQFPGFCGGKTCDAQVDKLQMPSGSQPDAPFKLYLIYRETARRGNDVYAQGDNQSSPTLLSSCDSVAVARVDGNPAKCVASITVKKHLKRVIVNLPNGGDPLCGKH